MTNGWLNSPLVSILTKRKIFVSYHHDNDQWFYNEFSRLFAEGYEAIQDNSVDRLIDSDDADYVMRRIREQYIHGTSCSFVLCGPMTRWRKYVDWEIKATLDKAHGLIGINLPHNPRYGNGNVHKPDRLQDNIDTGYALWISWEDLAAGPDYLRQCIEYANARDKRFIVNTRPLRERNGG